MRVIHDGGAWREDDPLSGFSVAQVLWEESESVSIRWNGGEGQPAGMLQSRGMPVWFIVPGPLAEALLHTMRQLKSDEVTAKSLLQAKRELVSAARRAPSEELARLQLYG